MGNSAVGESKEHTQEPPHLQLAQLDFQRPPSHTHNANELPAVTTSCQLQQGQNPALLEQKENLLKAQTPGFLSPSIVGSSSLQCTGLQDTCGGRETTEMTNSSTSKHCDNRCVRHWCVPASHHWKWHKTAPTFYLCEKKAFTLKNNTMSFRKNFYTLNIECDPLGNTCAMVTVTTGCRFYFCSPSLALHSATPSRPTSLQTYRREKPLGLGFPSRKQSWTGPLKPFHQMREFNSFGVFNPKLVFISKCFKNYCEKSSPVTTTADRGMFSLHQEMQNSLVSG